MSSLALVRATLVLGCVFLGHVTAPLALTSVRDDHWAAGTNVDGSTSFIVSFRAEVSLADADPQHGVRFTIAERNTGAANVPLLGYVLDIEGLPAPGSSVVGMVAFRVVCGPEDRFELEPLFWEFDWCDSTNGAGWRYGEDFGRGSRGSTSALERLELVIEDEAGNAAEVGTPEDAMDCGVAGKPDLGPGIEILPGRFAASGDTPLRWVRPLDNVDSRLQTVQAGAIGISFDPTSLQCEGPAPINQPLWLYVVVDLEGPTACGITGLELRIVGFPPEWIVSAERANPEAYFLGDPVSDGAAIALGGCRTGEAGFVPVCQMLVFPTTEVSDLVLTVDAHRTPSNPWFHCPATTICNQPMYSKFCMEGRRTVLNPRTVRCDGATRVHPSTWTRLKNLYRD